jgi:nitroimidazol reductase NimA-like FMN-containing flavoprotein (pyridoxamine 5'-phosphate oxidase superfamily)
MSTAEIDAFLRAHHEVVVAANHADGGTLATVGAYDFRAGALAVQLSAADPVVAALRVDDRACLTVEQFPSYAEIKAVVVHGRATVGPVSGEGPLVDVVVALGDDTVSFDFSKQQMPTE